MYTGLVDAGWLSGCRLFAFAKSESKFSIFHTFLKFKNNYAILPLTVPR